MLPFLVDQSFSISICVVLSSNPSYRSCSSLAIASPKADRDGGGSEHNALLASLDVTAVTAATTVAVGYRHQKLTEKEGQRERT
jgi:hypothetical protein